jgi:hypothetical protein
VSLAVMPGTWPGTCRISSETRLPHQLFYSALQISGHLYLTKHVIVYDSRSIIGEVLCKMSVLDSLQATQKAADLLTTFIQQSCPDVIRLLPKYFSTLHNDSWQSILAQFRLGLQCLTDSEQDVAFVRELSQWFYLH